MIRKAKKRIGRRGFKVDMSATIEMRKSGHYVDQRSFRSVCGHDVLYGHDMSARRLEVWKRDKGRCMLTISPRCRGFANLLAGDADHIVPRGKGGSDDLENLRWTCGPCHRSRHVHPRWTDPRIIAERKAEAHEEFRRLYENEV